MYMPPEHMRILKIGLGLAFLWGAGVAILGKVVIERPSAVPSANWIIEK